jgi:hypothetical protein
MNWFVDSLVREQNRTALTDGLKAFVRLYYDEFTDATEVEPEVLRTMVALLSALSMGPNEDVEEIVSEIEQEINEGGGVRSDSDGMYHKVCTYKED